MPFPKCSKPNKAGNKTCTIGKGDEKRTFTMHPEATPRTKARRKAFAKANRSMRFTKAKRYVCPRNKKGRFTRGCKPTPAMGKALTD